MLSDNQKAVPQYLGLALLLGWLTLKGIVPGWTTLHSDFGNYYVSARLVTSGAELDNLYNDDWFHDQMVKAGVNTPGKFSPFPPLTSWILVPLASLQPLTAQRVFVVINLAFVFLCAYAWKRITGWKYVASLLLVLAGGASVINNIAFGQVYVVMVTCLLFAILLIEKNKLIPAGILIGTLTALKYFPVVIIGGLFFLALQSTQPDRRRYHVAVIYSILTLIILIVGQFLFFGATVMGDYFFNAFIPHLGSNLSGQGMYSYLFQSWDSLARNLFVYDSTANPEPFINWPWGRLLLKMIVVVGLVSLTILAMYTQSDAKPSKRQSVFLSVPALAMLVILPASATYHFILLLLPMALLLRDGTLNGKTGIAMIVIYCLIGFIPYPAIFRFAESAGLFFAYPRLWLIVLLFGITAWDLARKSTQPIQQ